MENRPEDGTSPKRARSAATLLGVAALLAAVSAFAQGGGDGYDGVTPGGPRNPPRHRVVVERRDENAEHAILTWVGFQPQGDGGSRFFVQLSRPVSFELRGGEGRHEVSLPNTRVHLSNTWRPIDTRFFNTPVNSARVERRGRRDLAFVLRMRAPVAPAVSAAEGVGGYHFIYVDFPAGDYAPVAGPSPNPRN